jgi:hypothetical protein
MFEFGYAYQFFILAFFILLAVGLVLLIRLILAATRALNTYTSWRRLSIDLLISDNEPPEQPLPGSDPIAP